MLSVETHGATRRLILSRPERRNALGGEIMSMLLAELKQAEREPQIRAIVLTGAPPAFCAGSDLKELGGLSIADMCLHEADTAAVARYFAVLSKPIIAAVEGYALGGGFILAASCDVVVSAADARWHLPEVSNGWLPPWGLQALIARTGAHRARALCWGIAAMDGAQAQAIGLVDQICQPTRADEQAMAIAEKFALLPPSAVASCKRYFDPLLNNNADYLDRLASRHFADDCLGGQAQTVLAKYGEKK
ncbi:enoyl-CoA hydratase/isomerase family protein [Acerihabitans sp.]|uniref:enoyl-CoA hydratase/isomerase family protein n=1 Tax=Acerihabitans sp. TaxID=2811394 RepID=UPI002EDB70E1